MTHLNRLTAAAATVIIAVAAQLCLSCSSCGRGDQKSTPVDSTASANSPELILEGPLKLDYEAMRSYAIDISNVDEFDEADMAKMIRLAEGAFSHLMQELDVLQSNDDAADSYHVLNELTKTEWPYDAALIVSFLRTVPLPQPMQHRVDQLVITAQRCLKQLDEIADSQHNGEHYLELDINSEM